MITRREVLKAIAAAGLAVPIAQAYELDVPEGGLVVIHSHIFVGQENLKTLKSRLVEQTGRDNFTVVAMPLDMTIESIPEKEMNAAGWYRR